MFRAVLFLAAAALLTASTSMAQQLHTFVLQESPHSDNLQLDGISANSIFTYDMGTGEAVVASTVLVSALNEEAFVDAITYGRDIGGENSHSYFFFGIRLTEDGRLHGLSRTAMAKEPVTECEGDFWWAQDLHKDARAHGINRKVIDENSGTTVRLSAPPGAAPSASLGLIGRYGRPRARSITNSTNVGAFDLLEGSIANTRPVYFSIDRPALGYSPADILCHNAGQISVLFSATDLGLDPVTDNIDALSLNLTGENAPSPLGWISLSRESSSLVTLNGSGADIFQFRIDGPLVEDFHLHMTAESLGIGSHLGSSYSVDAEIDSIAHIDPPSSTPCGLSAAGVSSVALDCLSALDGGFSLSVNDRWTGTHQGTDTLLDYIPSATGADLIEIQGFQGRRPQTDEYLSANTSSILVEEGTLSRPENAGAEADPATQNNNVQLVEPCRSLRFDRSALQ